MPGHGTIAGTSSADFSSISTRRWPNARLLCLVGRERQTDREANDEEAEIGERLRA
jgi:hypothetical protein